MKIYSPALQAHLLSGATTLCNCWKITRRDGAVFGFTDHDCDIELDTVVCTAQTGGTTSSVTAGPDLCVGGGEVLGALTADVMDEASFEAGLWDRARVELWRVNWAAPEQRFCVQKGDIGEITRTPTAFRAELRSLTQALSETQGRIFGHLCDAVFCDARCGLSPQSFSVQGTVGRFQSPHRIEAVVPGEKQADIFADGTLTWREGAFKGQTVEIIDSLSLGEGKMALDLWESLSSPPAEGTPFTLLAGCDKRFETCCTRFNNAENFQGFPHIPGNDFALSVAKRDTGKNDGSAL